MLAILPLAALLSWSVPGDPRGPGGKPPVPDPPGGSLLEFKLELASDSSPYLHLTPDGFFVYLRNLLLRKLPVNRLEADPPSPLRMSRVAAWWPEFTPPKRTGAGAGAGGGQPLEDIVRVTDMPEQFWIRLSDDTVIQVSNDSEAGTASAPPPGLFPATDEVIEGAVAGRMVRVSLAPGDAQELYWLLQEETAIIY